MLSYNRYTCILREKTTAGTAGLRTVLAAGVIGAFGFPSAASADDAPSVPPPAGYAAGEFTDTQGCLFSRVEQGDRLLWAPRYRADGSQRCDGPVEAGAAECPLPTDVGRYAQAGVYVDLANARNAAAEVRALGLPVNIVRLTRNPEGRHSVVAGPFNGRDAARQGLGALRCNGFPDAFGRNGLR